MIVKRQLIMMMFGALAWLNTDCAQASDELVKIEAKFTSAREKLDAPFSQLLTGYKRMLGNLQKQFGENGNLNGVLTAKAAIKAGEPEAEKLSSVTEIAEAQQLYFAEKQKRLGKKEKDLTKLRSAYLTNLTKLQEQLTTAGLTTDAEEVISRIKELKATIEAAAPPPPASIGSAVGGDLVLSGRFYAKVDDAASFYVNGESVHKAKLGNSKSDITELKIGDIVVFSVHNHAGVKCFQTMFMSEDEKYVVSFAAEDLRVIPDGTKERVVSKGELSKIKEFANARTYEGEPKFPCEHESEYVWEHGNNAILATIITEQMISSARGVK
ncbi:MAG: hypothetical protein ACI9UA_000853 [Pseudoalteromonas tetraodonis]|jgi:hypothetical protein